MESPNVSLIKVIQIFKELEKIQLESVVKFVGKVLERSK